jgi:hypothetical protein
MSDTYLVRSTSPSSAAVADRELSKTETTRKVLRATIHDNHSKSAAVVSVALVHQRKGKKERWEDDKSPPFSSFKAGETAKFSMDSATTLSLYRELHALYEIHAQEGVPTGSARLVVAPEDEIIRTDGRRAHFIRRLLREGYAAEIWRELADEAPALAIRLGTLAIHREREQAVRQFEEMLGRQEREQVWQDFLDDNPWIFGYGLDYRILRPVQNQPNYGGVGIDHRGGRRGDNLTVTSGDVRFTVLVEIKTPDTPLLGERYRNGAYRASSYLSGAISQVQTNCQLWETEGSRSDRNRDLLGDILTVKPKGIVVLGRSSQLESRDQKLAFELLRRNTVTPEIITFDELLERARFIVASGGPADADAHGDAKPERQSRPVR